MAGAKDDVEEMRKHASMLRSAAATHVLPGDAETLDAIADKLFRKDDEGAAESGSEIAEGTNDKDGSSRQGGESGSSRAEGEPKTESEQLSVIAKRLADAVEGKSMLGLQAQNADKGGSEAGAESAGYSKEDLASLKSVASKLAALADGSVESESSSDQGGGNPAEAPVDPVISALGALESAMGESGASSVDGSETAEEAMTDDQLEARVDTLQSELDELKRDSGNSGSESENAGEAG